MQAKLVAPSLRHLLQYSPESLADDQLALLVAPSLRHLLQYSPESLADA